MLVRCDLDVPVKNGMVEETFRLDSALETLNYIIDSGGLPVIMGHMGRPGGKIIPDLSTAVLRKYFDSHLKGPYELLENLRFNLGEEANDPEFTKDLATGGEIYVNESFATSHRNAASITGVPEFLPAYAGFQLEKEVRSLTLVTEHPKRPLLAIIGGAKIESKKPVIQKFAQIADGVLVGGRLALEEEIRMDKVFCPVDYVDKKDIGPQTLSGWKDLILGARTVLWAGPMGAFEEEQYANGTRELAKMISHAKELGCFTVAGGGDTITALNKFDLADGFSFISTGGSAMLDFLVEGTLPGLSVIPN